MEVRETGLPGIGVRFDVTTRAGERLVVVVRRDGSYDLGLYDNASDPDQCRTVLTLLDEEAEALASLLGAPKIVDSLSELATLDGLLTDQIRLRRGSRYDGKTLGDTQARSRTGVSIVAVVREGQSIPSPTPVTPLVGEDVLVVVGTQAGVSALRTLLRDG